MKIIVVGLVRHGEDRHTGAPTFVVARRLQGVHLEGMWELPGGKVDGDESPSQALVRELREELGVDVVEVTPLTFSHHVYPPDKSLLLLFYGATVRPGQQPMPLAAQELRLLTREQLLELPMPAANGPLKDHLRSGR